MKTVLLPMIGYTIHPLYGINFLFSNNWDCYTINTNLNTYPVASDIPANTGGSGGVK